VKRKINYMDARFSTRIDGHSRRVRVWLCARCTAWHDAPNRPTGCAQCAHTEFIYCASRKEAKRAVQLLFEERHGVISGLEFQKTFPIFVVDIKTRRIVNPKVSYRPDSTYHRDGELVVEDVKGTSAEGDDPVFTLKRKLFEACYGTPVTVVRKVT